MHSKVVFLFSLGKKQNILVKKHFRLLLPPDDPDKEKYKAY